MKLSLASLRKQLTPWVLAWLLLCLLAWLTVPWLLKTALHRYSPAWLGRVVQVEQISFRPWSLELELHGLRVLQADGIHPQLSVQRVYVDAELQSLLRMAPVIDAIRLEQPVLELQHLGGGHYDIDDLLQRWLAPDDAPTDTRFALFNAVLDQGQIVFHDRPLQRTHRLEQLLLDVPFLSNLPSKRDVWVEPRLSFVLNGSAFDSRWHSQPFAQTHPTRASLRVPQLDLQPYLPYWPAQLPIRPEAGNLDVTLEASFEQTDTPQLQLQGSINLRGMRLLNTADASPWLGWEQLQIDIAPSALLARQVHLAAVQWDAPKLHLSRDGHGQGNWNALLHSLGQTPTPTPSAPATPAPATTPEGWQLGLDRFTLQGGAVTWLDAAVKPKTQLEFTDLSLKVNDLQWPQQHPASLAGSVALGQALLKWQGEWGAESVAVQVQGQHVPLQLAQPYLNAWVRPELRGQLDWEARLHWAAESQAITLEVPSVTTRQLEWRLAGRPQATLQNLDISHLKLSWPQRQIAIERVLLERPWLAVSRNSEGTWMWENWMAQPLDSSEPNRASSRPGLAWQAQVETLQIKDGRAHLQDAFTARPVELAWRGLDLTVRNLNSAGRGLSPTQLQWQMAAGPSVPQRGHIGQVQFKGQLQLPDWQSPSALSARGQLALEDVPLHALEPYFGEHLNLDLIRADTSYRGHIQASHTASGLSLQLAGDAAVEDLRASTLAPQEDLLDWKSLQLRGLKLDLQRNALKGLEIQETVLSDYFARLVIDPEGVLNLTRLLKPAATVAATAPQEASPTQPAPAAEPPLIRFGPVSLVNGRVYFSDRFIQPNYSARLSELTGTLGAFDNQAPAANTPPPLANLALRGRAEGTATLDISGQLNPLMRPLALDVQAKVTELELPPLSPYSVKYAGHGIERGKLSMDVRYRIDSQGQLNANNQLVLNQLRFGDRVEGSSAPNLPIKLAVALLADSDGVIDINLPISGSINDPQFRLGPVIVKMVFNLIGKAITSPFALLRHALEGGEEMSRITFTPGSAVLDAQTQRQLQEMAAILQKKPALKLTITGQSHSELEKEGYRRAKLDEWVLMEKRRQAGRAGEAVDGIRQVEASEYPALLKQVYKRADMAKPRNLIGLLKDLEQAEMEKLLLSTVAVNDNAMRELAVARAVAIKDYFIQQQVPAQRLFLGQPKLNPQDEGWKPHADLTLGHD